MTNMDKLQQLITQNNGIVTTADLKENNIARTYLQIFVKKGLLEKVGRGIYCEPGVWDDEMYLHFMSVPSIVPSASAALGVFCVPQAERQRTATRQSATSAESLKILFLLYAFISKPPFDVGFFLSNLL